MVRPSLCNQYLSCREKFRSMKNNIKMASYFLNADKALRPSPDYGSLTCVTSASWPCKTADNVISAPRSENCLMYTSMSEDAYANSFLQIKKQQMQSLQMNIWNIIYLNCGERYEDIVDHRSYTHMKLKPDELQRWSTM